MYRQKEKEEMREKLEHGTNDFGNAHVLNEMRGVSIATQKRTAHRQRTVTHSTKHQNLHQYLK
jgi:hypothetical protein